MKIKQASPKQITNPQILKARNQNKAHPIAHKKRYTKKLESDYKK
jgi:hypothetical protein